MFAQILKFTLGITQQLIKNGGAMVTSLALALFLEPDELGAFAIVVAVHSFFNLMHSAFLSEPLMLFSWRQYRDNQRGYLRQLRQFQFWAMAGSMALLAAVASVAVLAGAPTLVTGGLWVLVLIQPLSLLTNYLERRLFMHLRLSLALVGASLQLIVVIGLIVIVSQFSTLTVDRAFALMGLGYGVAALSHLVCLRYLPAESDTGAKPGLRDVLRQHTDYGAWSGLAHGLWWLTQNIYIFSTGWFLSLAAVGNFKILITLTNPGTLAMSALGVVLMPMLTSASDEAERRRILRLSFGLVLGAGSVFAVAFFAVAPWGIEVLFGDKFSLTTLAILIASVYPIAAGLQFVIASAVRAQGLPRFSVLGGALGLAFIGPFGLAAVYWLNVSGAMAAQVITVFAVFGAIAFLFYGKGTHQSPKNKEDDRLMPPKNV